MRPIRIGITGGIGSGKSYLCQLLTQQYHIPIYNCDREAKRLNEEDDVIRQGLVQYVGQEVYHTDGTLNKELLSNYLFASPQHINQINALIHPRVERDFNQWCDRQTAPIIGMESAILFESGISRLVDYSLLVSAPQAIRIKRVQLRDGSTVEQIKKRMQAQMSEEEKAQRASFIVYNDDSRPLTAQLDAILQSL